MRSRKAGLWGGKQREGQKTCPAGAADGGGADHLPGGSPASPCAPCARCQAGPCQYCDGVHGVCPGAGRRHSGAGCPDLSGSGVLRQFFLHSLLRCRRGLCHCRDHRLAADPDPKAALCGRVPGGHGPQHRPDRHGCPGAGNGFRLCLSAGAAGCQSGHRTFYRALRPIPC